MKLYIDLIRPYTPSASIDWLEASFDSSILAYADAEIEAEFQRFSLRDFGPIIPAFVWASGQFLFPIVIPGQFPTPVREFEFAFATFGYSMCTCCGLPSCHAST
jgi:hypothetical protein